MKSLTDMLNEAEARGYARAEMDIYKGICNICKGEGMIDAWNSFTGLKETGDFAKMVCWKCCGDGKLPAKCDRDKE